MNQRVLTARAITALAAAGFILLGIGLIAPRVRAASPGSGSVGETSLVTTWSGAAFAAAANTGGSTSGCFNAAGQPNPTPTTAGTAACDYFVLNVEADDTYWSTRAGGVTVQVTMLPADDFDLYVFRRNADGSRGALVGDSERGGGVPESVFLGSASGAYYVVVTGWLVAAGTYEGRAEFESFAATEIEHGPPVSSYLHDVSPPIPGVSVANSIVEQHRVRVADGVHIDSWVVRPPTADKVPVIVQVTPYYGGGSPVLPTGGHLLGTAGNTLVPRGYAYAMVSVRGTGNSEGCFSIGGPQEAKDTAAVIEHYAAQPWANGSVGMLGVSYDGTTQQDVWVEAPPSLKTIVPIAGISDLYKYNFVNGVPIVIQGFGFNTYYWGLTGLGPAGLYVGSTQLRDPVNVPGAIAGEVCSEQVWVQEGGVSSSLDGNKDGYWQARDFLAELRQDPKKPRASVFYVHGLGDWNVKPDHMDGWLPAVQATGVPFKAYLGQWGHAYPNRADWWGTPTTPSALVAWFDQFLKGRNTGILDAPRVQVLTDAGDWRHEQVWPPVKVKEYDYRLFADGSMARTGTPSGSVSYYDYQGGLTWGTVEQGSDRVVWVSEPLEKDLHISGMPRFEGTVTASGARASLMLTLLERKPTGDRAINFGALSLNHAQDLSNGNPNIAGLSQQVGVNFFPQEDVVRAGNRLVLIAAGNLLPGGESGPSLQPVSDGSVITIQLGGAQLRIPVDRSVLYEQ